MLKKYYTMNIYLILKNGEGDIYKTIVTGSAMRVIWFWQSPSKAFVNFEELVSNYQTVGNFRRVK